MKEKRNVPISAWLAMVGKLGSFLLLVLIVVGCTPASSVPDQPVKSQTEIATQLVLPTETTLPSPTATEAPTATLEPSATPTRPPTATPVPALAVLKDGFAAWCAPVEYAGTKPLGPDAPDYARKMVARDTQIEVPIPAAFCTLVYRFNQPVPNGVTLTFFDGKNPFLKLPLQAAQGHAEEAWASVAHDYVVNPPLWYIDYRLSVTSPDGKELWTNPVRFAKPLPQPCQTGGYPDPVTLYCNPFDPREIEPHPEDPNYKYATPNP